MLTTEHITPRLAGQSALFTVSSNPLLPLEEGLCGKIVIKANVKTQILKTLGKYGVHSGALFPGLDGVCKYIEDHQFLFRGVRDRNILHEALEEEFQRRRIEA